jgi:hypothetical protein
MSFQTLIAATLPLHESKVADNVTKNFTFLKMLGDKDLAPKLYQMKEPEAKGKYAEGIKLVDDPGRSIIVKLRKGRNNTAKAYSRFDTLDVTPQDNADEAEFQWKSMSVAVHLAQEDLDKNRGNKTKIFDLLQFSLDDASISIQELFNDYLLGARPASDSKRPSGLLDIVQDDPTSLPSAGSEVIGGIDASASANSYWRNQVKDHAAASFGTDQTGTGMSNLRTLVRSCTFGSKKPSVILAGTVAFEALEKALVNQLRYNDPRRSDALTSAGITNIMFHDIPVVWEPQIDVQRSANSLSNSAFYALNLEHLRVYGMKFRWFKMTDFREPTNQDSTVAHCITRAQLVTDARRLHGVMFNVA